MQLVANISIGLCFALYFVSAYFGYTTFYGEYTRYTIERSDWLVGWLIDWLVTR